MNVLFATYKLLDEIIRGKAYSKIALDKAAATPAVRRIVLGTLEKNFELDGLIDAQIKTSPGGAIRLILKQGAYCLLYMDSMPAYAVIHESVELAKKLGKSGAGGFVNAVLKKLSSGDARAVAASDETVKYGKPQWIIDLVKSEYSAEDAAKILSAVSEERVHFRFNRFAEDIFTGDKNSEAALLVGDKTSAGDKNSTPEKIFMSDKKVEGALLVGDKKAEAALLVERGIEVEPTAAGGYLARQSAALKELFAAGVVTFQSASSMLVVRSADIFEGARVLDVCAAPGGKAVYAAEFAGAGGAVTVCDIHKHRVRLIEAYVRRMHCLDKTDIREVDATAYTAEFDGAFDFVFADVPCSGLGTMREKADIALNKRPEDIASLAKLQSEILANSARYVKKGGVLTYSTCTVTDAENGAVIRGFLCGQDDFFLEKIPVPVEGLPLPTGARGDLEASGAAVQLLPEREYDGFYICRIRRKA
ncbi:MAG: hypothetical protein LBT55_00855 [Clostridiaceae bacterium]|jgi:16S rRNA (cytosine967-C5)-methyltransferase|nr:hypothetical protein [Clostridiaceae bacterium]